jgi:hypothetical protein
VLSQSDTTRQCPYTAPGFVPFPMLVQRQALPHRARIVEHVLEGGKPRTDDTRTPNSVWIVQRNRLVEHGVEAEEGDQRDLLVGAVQPQFEDAVGLISEELHGHSWQPAP